MTDDIQTSLIPENEVPLAAVDLPKINLRRHHFWIMRSIYTQGPASDQQLSERLNLAENSIRPRRKELSDRRYLEVVGRVQLPTGGHAKQYGLTMRGIEQAVKEPE